MVNAPERARPQANAMVTALDPEGRVVGMSLTGPDGRFRLDSIPPGKVTLEARVEPSSGAANVTLEMTSSGKGLLHPNAKYPVSREAAAQIALEGKSYPLVTGTLNPLPEGTVVDAFEGAASGGRVLPADEWLFMINEGPLLGYAHPVEFVFVDARTGARAQFSAQFYPTINGVSMWGSTDYLFQYAAGSAPLAGPEVVQVSPELLSLLANTRQIEDILARNNTTADSIFAVLLGLDTGFENGVPLFQKFLVDRGVPMANIRTVMYDDTERNALTRPKVVNDKNIPKYSSILVPRIRAAFDQINALINDRFRRGQHSSEIVLITSHGSAAIPGGIVIGGDSVGGFGNFIDLGMVRNLSCRIDFLVDCCYSGRFITELHKFLKDNEFPHQCFFYSSSGLKEFTQSGGLLPQTGKWLVFVTQAAQVTQGGLEGLKGTKPMEQVPKLQEITHTLPKGNAQEAPSNPIYLDFTPAKDPCPTTSPTPPGNPPPKVPTSNDQTSRLEFENRSQD
ncbi:carboxypeptidase regulatory-like domain-containing protein, partial [bacterium]|nr:carboxypeptidase regulatory-like domain-containing protein [bacterium]